MSRKDELKAKIKEMVKELHAIEQAEASPAAAALVGNCYKYQNSYSCPREEKDYWWLYTMVVASNGGYVTAFEFQTDCDGKPDIRFDRSAPGSYFDSGHVVITREEFDAEWVKWLKQITDKARAINLPI